MVRNVVSTRRCTTTLRQNEHHGCQHHRPFHSQFRGPPPPGGQQDLAPDLSFTQVHTPLLPHPPTTHLQSTLHPPTHNLGRLQNHHTDTNHTILKRPMSSLSAASSSRSSLSSSNGPLGTSHLIVLVRTRLPAVVVASRTRRATRIWDRCKAG